MSTREVAEFLGRPVGTINRWAAEGKLRSVKKLGDGRTSARLYRRRDVEKFAKTLPPAAGAEVSA